MTVFCRSANCLIVTGCLSEGDVLERVEVLPQKVCVVEAHPQGPCPVDVPCDVQLHQQFSNKIGPPDPEHVLAKPATVAFAYICITGEPQCDTTCTSPSHPESLAPSAVVFH